MDTLTCRTSGQLQPPQQLFEACTHQGQGKTLGRRQAAHGYLDTGSRSEQNNGRGNKNHPNLISCVTFTSSLGKNKLRVSFAQLPAVPGAFPAEPCFSQQQCVLEG